MGDIRSKSRMSKRRSKKPHRPDQKTAPDQESGHPLANISPEILENLPENTRIAFIQSASFQGPLPPPALYREYEEVKPGAVDRILAFSDKEQAHRHHWEIKAMEYSNKEVVRGQWMGFAISIVALGLAAYCASLGQKLVGGVVGGASIAGILTAFIKKRKSED